MSVENGSDSAPGARRGNTTGEIGQLERAVRRAYYVAELLFPKLPMRPQAWPAEALAAG